jgi:hypothetical protein
MSQCDCNEIYEDSSFPDPADYSRLERNLKSAGFTEVPVETPYQSFTRYKERWFKCGNCGKVWRLVRPDYPFPGVWEAVDPNQ